MLNQLYKDVLDSLESYIVVIDREGKVVFTNTAWLELLAKLGANTDISWLGRQYLSCCELLQVGSFEYKQKFKQAVTSLDQEKQCHFVLECPYATIESSIWLETKVTRINCEHQSYLLLEHKNIIERKIDQAEIKRLTLKDATTGLANNRGFSSFFENEWLRAKRSHYEVAILVAELDSSDLTTTQRLLIADVFSKRARRACDLACSLKPQQFSLVLGQVEAGSVDVIARDIDNEIKALNLINKAGNAINIHIAFSSTVPTLIDETAMLLDAVSLALEKAKKMSASTIASHCPTIVFKQVGLMKA